MGKENFIFKIIVSIKEVSKREFIMVMENTDGQMEIFSEDNIVKVKEMALEFYE